MRDFFDALASEYRDGHGDAERLLRDRLALIRRLLPARQRASLLEIGCGTGIHLFALAGEFAYAAGVDLSPQMIAAAERTRARDPRHARVRLVAEPAERMASIADDAVDAVLCVGAFEHMPDPHAVLVEVVRVLRPGGVFVCLSPNGGYVWYTRLAPWLGLETRHLSSDRFIVPNEWPRLLRGAGLEPSKAGTWRFVPSGDMPRGFGFLLAGLDRIGAALRIAALRGGYYVRAIKPARAAPADRAGG